MLGRTLLLLGTAFVASRVVEAVTCRPNTIPYNGECLCLTSSAVNECTDTQDCSYTNGCECNRAECSCGSGHCKDVGLCNAVTGRCKCGNAGKQCLPEETCFRDICICDRETFMICQGGTTCRNKQCYCGQRVCGAEEVCVGWPTPYCACGNFPRMCEANEVCEFDGYKFYCKCGGEICETEEVCVAWPTPYCACGNFPRVCEANEFCEFDGYKFYCKCGGEICGTEEVCVAWPTPYCACGNFPRVCEANEFCEFDGYNFYCKCGGKICGTEEKCEYHNGSYTCTCNGNVCDEHELCIKPYQSDPPFCICGKKECAVNEKCGVIGTTKLCLCGKNLCPAPITCRVDGTCLDQTTATTAISVTTTEQEYPINGTSGCLMTAEHGYQCYFVRNGEAMTFKQAQAACGEHDDYGSLISIMSDNEQSFVTSLITNATENPYWIGLFRLHEIHGSSIMYRYSWVFTTEPSVTYTNWDNGYPNDTVSSFDCVAANLNSNSRGKWRNTDCNRKLGVICSRF